MTAAIVTSACHSRRVTRAPLCPACVLAPITTAPPITRACATCEGRRVLRKMSGVITCPDCTPLDPCHYCGDTGTMRDGRPCEGIGCRSRGGVR